MTEVSKERGKRKTLQGVVVSDSMDKTINVEVVTIGKHSLYKKTVRKSKRFMAHDENNDCNKGDMVRIMETRPLSKNKRWRLIEIVERAK